MPPGEVWLDVQVEDAGIRAQSHIEKEESFNPDIENPLELAIGNDSVTLVQVDLYSAKKSNKYIGSYMGRVKENKMLVYRDGYENPLLLNKSRKWWYDKFGYFKAEIIIAKTEHS